ncbi:hypothetical protein [Pantoea sp. GL120224-02]|jgi:hypothetical protein|uniref:hypothetical protein n=1 Tax=Pantoea sp. GL120224-02 TaxID=1378084 RepID=UPI000BD3D79A|nr:hypothetical protein [Pantoea sp. GL120224-02]SNY71026.1 hypothetical protein SAMN02744778_03129 [Pantoea sp. GL120224-02]
MQNREAAQCATESLLSAAKIITGSFEKLDALEQEGKVTEEESDRYQFHVMESLDDMFESVLKPIFEIHPDLRPPCPCCDSAEEEEN